MRKIDYRALNVAVNPQMVTQLRKYPAYDSELRGGRGLVIVTIVFAVLVAAQVVLMILSRLGVKDSAVY